ncbi:hypothetical protein D0463_18660 [Bacillus sp. V59.32b]|nr:hypothetical protein D0463_18660 [Bacillus sp. V59.32b]
MTTGKPRRLKDTICLKDQSDASASSRYDPVIIMNKKRFFDNNMQNFTFFALTPSFGLIRMIKLKIRIEGFM